MPVVEWPVLAEAVSHCQASAAMSVERLRRRSEQRPYPRMAVASPRQEDAWMDRLMSGHCVFRAV
eukprot:8856034-Pyramimonas_sp.AAC.1